MNKLRTRLVFLIAIAILPSIILLAFTAGHMRQFVFSQFASEAEQVASSIRSSEAQVYLNVIESSIEARRYLETIELSQLDIETCRLTLDAISRNHELIMHTYLIDANGDIVCTPTDSTSIPVLAELEAFRYVNQQQEASPITYVVENGLNIYYGTPIQNNDRETEAVMIFHITPDWLNSALADYPLLEDSRIHIINRTAQLITLNSNDLSDVTIRPLFEDDELLASLQKDNAFILLTDHGNELFGFTMYDMEDSENVHFGISQDTDTAFREVYIQLFNLSLAILLTMITAFAIIWFGSQRLIFNDIGALLETTRRLQNGDLNARTLMSPKDGEIGELGRAFDEMAVTLQERIAQSKQQENELNILYLATSSLLVQPELSRIGQQIAETMVAHFNYVDCGVMLVDERTGVIERHGRVGKFPVRTQEILKINGPGLVAECIRQGKLIYVPDVSRDPRYMPNNKETKSELVVPLMIDEWVLGALDMQSPNIDGFSERDQRIVSAFVQRASIAIHNARLYEIIQNHANDLEQRVKQRTEELERALMQEKHLASLKTRFASMVSHEFKNPLAVMSTSIDLLTRFHDRITEEKRKEHAQIVKLQLRRLVELLDDILLISRDDAVGMDYTPSEVDINTLCKTLVYEHQLVSADSHNIIYDYDSTCHVLYADGRLLRLMINNLLTNAIKYSPTGSDIRLTISCTNKHINIECHDQGIGIPEDDLEKLFEDFHRAKNVGEIPGTGLGLAVVKRVVEVHGGTIDVNSRINEGTVFSILLPIRKPSISDRIKI